MRHVYIRGILAVVWLAAAVVSGISGRFEMAFLYVIMGGIFLYSAYRALRQNKDGKGEQ